jgi:hypothetical protein
MIAECLKKARCFLSPVDDRMSGDEAESFGKLSRSARRTILRQRRHRINDVWTPPADAMGGGAQTWQELLESTVADGTQISNSTAETIVVPDFSIPAYYMAAGRTLRLWAYGVMSNVVTTPGTLILSVRWGGVAGTVLMKTAALGLDTTARTNSLWALHGNITCRSAGSSGSFLSGGIAFCNVLSSTAANLLPNLMGSAGAPLASGSTAVTVDTTTAKLLSITATFSVSTSPTNLTCQQRTLEALN